MLKHVIKVSVRNMPSIVSGYSTERCLRSLLETEVYELSPLLYDGETGCDVIANKGKESIYIEVIGYKSSGPARARDFFNRFSGLSLASEKVLNIVLSLCQV